MSLLNRKTTRYLAAAVFTALIIFITRQSISSDAARPKLATDIQKYASNLKEYGIQRNEKLSANLKNTASGSEEDVDGNLGYTPMTWQEVKAALTFDESLLANIKDNIVEENMDFFREVYSKRITEPKFSKLTYNQFIDENGHKSVMNKDEYPRANATLLTLVRNQELQDIVHTIRQLETNWNHNYHYPYTFINDEPFSEEFKETVQRQTLSDCYFEIIPPEMWNKPKNIDETVEAEKIAALKAKGVQYIDKVSYHNMCRFNSGKFYEMDRLKQFRYYWRFEPATDYYCQIDYDLFKFMEDNNKTYGFTISLYDNPLTVETLWPVTLEHLRKYPEHVHPNGAFRWLTENVQHPDYTAMTGGYSTCHFWSNFEIGDMDFYRGEAYTAWFNALEEAGGFYYERWGDAPVHSVGLGLFEDRSKIHWFRDIGYHHSPYKNIPNSDKCNAPEDSGYFAPADVHDQNCLSNWIRLEMTNKELQEY